MSADRQGSWAPRRLARYAIRAYQLTIATLVGGQCRYLPTCSHYADEAIAAHGAWRGGWMALARLCRCHPWSGSGYDPPPPSCSDQRWYAPWRHGRWRFPPRPDQDRASNSAASP